jgi:hypothetical protein
MEIEEIAREVVDSGYRMHTRLGPGLLESVFKSGIKRIVNNHSDFASSRLRVHQDQAPESDQCS